MFTRSTRHANPRTKSRARVVMAGSTVFVVGVALAGCSGVGSSSTQTKGMAIPLRPAGVSHQHTGPVLAGGSAVGITVSSPSPLIVRTGSLVLQLRRGSVTRAFDQVSAQVSTLQGFVSSSATSGLATASLVLRVPSDEFSKLVDEITGDGHTLSEHLNGQDVTGETINLHARITNLTAEEASLRSLLSRAGSISSILNVQDQLFNVEGDIEELTAQESSLVDQATFATIDVSLQTTAAPVPRPRQQNSIGRAVSMAGRNSIAVVRGIVLALGWAFPVAVLGLIAGGVLWARRRRRTDAVTGSGVDPAPAAP